MKLRKYWKITYNSLSETLTYRANLATSFLVIALPFFLAVIFWKAVYSSREQMASFTLAQMITYYFLVLFTQDFTYPVLNYEIAMDIKNGQLSYYLIRPIKYPIYAYFLRLGGNIAYFLIVLAFIPLYFAIFHKYIIFNPSRLPTFAMSLIFSYILATLISLFLSFLTFFLEDFRGLTTIMDFLVPILSGALIPLKLLPEPLFKISQVLPFRYLINYPIELYLNAGTFTFKELLTITGWILTFLLANVWVWEKGRKKFQAVGG